MSVTIESLRAAGFSAEQAWESARGMWTAFQVETGCDIDVSIPTWGDLPNSQRIAFTRRWLHMLKDGVYPAMSEVLS